jgi:hypothetical protein
MGRGGKESPSLTRPLNTEESRIAEEVDKAFSRNWRQGLLLKGGEPASRRNALDHCLDKLDPLEIAFACKSVDKRDREDLLGVVRGMALRVLEEICPRRNLIFCQEALSFFTLDLNGPVEMSREGQEIIEEVFGHFPFNSAREGFIEDALKFVAALAVNNSKRVIFVFDGADKLDDEALSDIIRPFNHVTAANYNNLMLVLSGPLSLHSRLFEIDQDSSMMFSVASFRD